MIGYLLHARGTASTVCHVFEQPYAAADVETRAEELAFVREGFSWPVALLPPVALLAKGAWLGLVVYLLAAFALLAAAGALQVGGEWVLLGLVALGAIAGLESASLERWWLRQRGWNEVGLVSGADVSECERRFFEAWLPKHKGAAAEASAADVAVPEAPGSDLRRVFAVSR